MLHGVTLASPTPASSSVAVSAVSSKITVVSSTTVVSITAVDSLVNSAEEAGETDVSGADVSVFAPGESSVEAEVSAGSDEFASVAGGVVVSEDSVVVVVAVVEVSAGAEEVSPFGSEVVVVGDVVGFTGAGLVVVFVDASPTETTEASPSAARAASHALLSFSHPAPNVSALTPSARLTARAAVFSLTQPGLRRDVCCRGSFVFVIVSR